MNFNNMTGSAPFFLFFVFFVLFLKNSERQGGTIHSTCFLRRLLLYVALGFRLWLRVCWWSRWCGSILLVCSCLEDVVVVSFHHEELSKMVLAVEVSIKSSIGRMCQMAPTMSTPKACLVVTVSFQCHLETKKIRQLIWVEKKIITTSSYLTGSDYNPLIHQPSFKANYSVTFYLNNGLLLFFQHALLL